MQVNIGGQRIGSGGNMTTELHNYGYSTHNLSENFKTSAAPGVLIPFFVKPVMVGDQFEIDMDAIVRTLPTIGPLFGSFKLQADFFFAGVRLYQGILHNNPINIGMKMNQVLLPQIEISHKYTAGDYAQNNFSNSQMATNCLLKYLGLSGLGRSANEQMNATIKRKINAVPALMYYDIFKNYYANKQEEKAYVITNVSEDIDPAVYKIKLQTERKDKREYVEYQLNEEFVIANNQNLVIDGAGLSLDNVLISIENRIDTLNNYIKQNYIELKNYDETYIWIKYKSAAAARVYIELNGDKVITNSIYKLKEFPLENIDNMRRDILGFNTLGERFIIQDGMEGNFLPYNTLFSVDVNDATNNRYPMNGLVVKTYQSDIYNNWINTDWIEGENGIAEITKVSVTDGSIKLDDLLLQKQIYNMLNRVATAGGTYQDWEEVNYTHKVLRHAETPMYYGGMSSEVVFEEVVSTSESGDNRKQQLGGLAGKGTLVGKNGGHIEIDVPENGFIMGIVSLTPRIDYTQGNEFYMTEFNSVDDFHKPALDGVGFQDLMVEQMAWWDTVISPNSSSIIYRGAVGKTPAWINYMTSVDKAYGDFADMNKAGYMILGRNYEVGDNTTGIVKDLTTYIDPQKFNYPFAYAELDAQNFWINIGCKVKARRIMSAKIIPNL